MRTRKISVMTMAAVALGLALTACTSDGADSASSASGTSSTAAASSSSTAAASTPRSDTAESKASGTPAQSEVKCTDQLNYTGDPRSNAEINSTGKDTGTCPPVEPK
ncbi:hypothetical protein OG596_15350 [Streptomyces sp. NBC_01102]|uniref:hypothetical protein n=1 Tax=Streptomyces sp. NBC_01102 TaxID=2903749 RepID=UPI00386E4A10|nr:hypothetical protein OG596_15350 [Streptomyces sp. NBC_01102]